MNTLKLRKAFAVLLALFMLILPVRFERAEADGAAMQPAASFNLSTRLRKFSSLVRTNTGYLRVFCRESDRQIVVEHYSNAFALTARQYIDMELPYWGGFYAGANAYYIVEGQLNTQEDNAAEVFRVIKYDTSFRRLGAASITGTEEFGAQVRIPFDYGCVEMTEVNGKLFIVTGHEGYVDPTYNQGHQGFLMIEVDETAMTGSIVKSDLWHSFAQYIQNDGNDLYVLEQSEGSRYTKLRKFDAANINPDYFSSVPSLNVFQYGGDHTSAWALACYASVDDLALSDANILGIGTSIDQSQYDNVTSDTPHNIYLTVTPKANFTEEATQVKWLTNYTDAGKCFMGVRLVRISGSRLLVMWEENDEESEPTASNTLSGYTLHYRFIDGSGNFLGSEYTAAAPISEMHPVLNGSNVVFCASNENMVSFCTINSTTGAFSETAYRTAGDYAAWRIDNGTLYVEGSGAITIDPHTHDRYPVSDCSYSYWSSDGDNVWKSVRDGVTKIVIANGITEIPADEFKYFSALTTVDIGKDVHVIGSLAFYSNNALRDVYVRSVDAVIGEDIIWTGYYYYNDAHVYRAKLHGYEGSTTETYAAGCGISFELLVGEWVSRNGKWYYLRDGEPAVGWIKSKGVWYYADGNGVMQTGWQQIGGKWYWFNASGAMQTGWQKLGGNWYHLNAGGVMQTGWQKIDGKWYWFNASGAMQTGWQKIDGKWYYMNASGVMQTGWQKLGGNWYYLNAGGVMQTGWQKIGGNWYYMNASGVMQTGWQQISNQWYYFNASGVMLTGTQTIGGIQYTFSSSGVWIP